MLGKSIRFKDIIRFNLISNLPVRIAEQVPDGLMIDVLIFPPSEIGVILNREPGGVSFSTGEYPLRVEVWVLEDGMENNYKYEVEVQPGEWDSTVKYFDYVSELISPRIEDSITSRIGFRIRDGVVSELVSGEFIRGWSNGYIILPYGLS